MKYLDCVNNSQNINELKRIASAYVEDCRRLDFDELKASLIKTKGQYVSYENIEKQLNRLKLHENPTVRIIVPIILQSYLLDEDEFTSLCKATEEAVVKYEQSVIDESNNFDYKNMSKDFNLLKFVLDEAWLTGDKISVDEKNLIEKIRKYLNITAREQNMLEAKAGRYPTKGNILHNRSDIDLVRKILQSVGILFYIKNSDNVPCDIIPEEIVLCLRKYYDIEIRNYGYKQMISYVTKITKKQYLIDVIKKYNENPKTAIVDLPINPTISSLQEIILKTIKPSNLLGGFSPRDGLDGSDLSLWCGNLGLSVSGTKATLISRILEYYDKLRKIETSTEDEREKFYNMYHELACRNLVYLRENNLILKDLECEHYFEKATNYLFEIMLKNKPLLLTGTEHPDGKLSYNDKYILWDNKSKETPVNLLDHIGQFDRYIKNSDKPVSVFMVIAPSFTENSVKECVKYSLKNDTQILLITADELKEVAVSWHKSHPDESFNLGFFKQNGRFDKSLLIY
ncbi:MAG: hypothetical protein IK147_04315 [Clostridia bacterium]|nr:hypothetical protein [Clostridia bacterium]